MLRADGVERGTIGGAGSAYLVFAAVRWRRPGLWPCRELSFLFRLPNLNKTAESLAKSREQE